MRNKRVEKPTISSGEVSHEQITAWYDYARRVAGSRLSPEDAEDIAQESVIRAMKSFDSFRGDGDLSAWFGRIVKNRIHTQRGRLAVKKEREYLADDMSYLDALSGGDVAAQTVNAFEAAEDKIAHRGVLAAALARLPKRDRESVVLHDLVGLPDSEIAVLTGYSESSAKVGRSLGRKALRNELAPILAPDFQLAAEHLASDDQQVA